MSSLRSVSQAAAVGWRTVGGHLADCWTNRDIVVFEGGDNGDGQPIPIGEKRGRLLGCWQGQQLHDGHHFRGFCGRN